MTAILPVVGVDTQTVGHTNLNDYLNAKFSGSINANEGSSPAIPDTGTDQRANLQNALDAGNSGGAARKVVSITKPGVYNLATAEPISGQGSLALRSDSELIIGPGVTLKNNRGTAFASVLFCDQVSNVKIVGGIIDGNRAVFPTAGCNCVYVLDSNNVHIDLMELKNASGTTLAGQAAGDGVSIRGVASLGNIGSTYVTVSRCHIHDCVRQGLGVYRANKVALLHNYIHDIVGTDPGGGIDLEPDTAGADVNNIIIDGNFIKTANYGIIAAALTKYFSITNNQVDACVARALHLSDAQQGQVSGNLFVQAANYDGFLSYVDGERSYWIQAFGNQMMGGGASARAYMQLRECFDFTIDDNQFVNTVGKALQVTADLSLDTSGTFVTNNKFRNCATGDSVIEFAPTTHLIKQLICRGNAIHDERSGGSQATNGILLTGVTGPELLTWDIDKNMFVGVTNNYAGFPAGYGPGGQVPTADIPAAAATMDGKDLIEYIDATHRSLVWYRNGKRFKGASVAES